MISSQITRVATFAMLGQPNAGKSTLLNALIGEKIAPVHRKPQMTRKNLLGIDTRDNCQLIFTDTPGFHLNDQLLNRELNLELQKAVEDCDFALVLIDVTEAVSEEFKALLHTIKSQKLIFVLNKTDVPQKHWKTTPGFVNQEFPGHEALLISAITKAGVEELRQKLQSLASESPFLFPDDELTTANMREITANIILEKVMENLGQEIPYQAAVVIENYKETAARDEISALIVVNRDSQKGMVIGKGGVTLKKIGTAARLELQKFLDRKVFLQIFVKVDKNWIKSPGKIQEYYGFERRKN